MVWLIVVVNSILPYHRSLVTHPQPLNSHTDILTEFRNTFPTGILTIRTFDDLSAQTGEIMTLIAKLEQRVEQVEKALTKQK